MICKRGALVTGLGSVPSSGGSRRPMDAICAPPLLGDNYDG